jgi:hypothetical protein
MANWIRFNLKGDYDLILRLRRLPGRMMEVLRVKLDALTNKTAGDIVADKLSGQILHHRTGNLAASVHATPTVIEGNTIRGGIEAAGGSAFYGKIHEFGTAGMGWEIRSVKARALAFQTGGTKVFAKSVFHPPLPPRAFMKPTALELQEMLNESLSRAVADVLKEI